jgi:hypothetical protein
MWDAASGNDGFDAGAPDQAAVLVVVITTVGVQAVRSLTRSADPARTGGMALIRDIS